MGIKFTNNEQKLEKYLQPVYTKECEHFKLARKFMHQKNYRKAIKEYLMSMIFTKSDIETYKEISKAYKKIKCYDKAINHLKKAKLTILKKQKYLADLILRYTMKWGLITF